MIIETRIFDNETLYLIKEKNGYVVKWCSMYFEFSNLREALDYYEKFGK